MFSIINIIIFSLFFPVNLYILNTFKKFEFKSFYLVQLINNVINNHYVFIEFSNKIPLQEVLLDFLFKKF